MGTFLRSFGGLGAVFGGRARTSGGISIKFREHLRSLVGSWGFIIIILGSSALFRGCI